MSAIDGVSEIFDPADWDDVPGFENLTGSAYNDTLVGNSGDNVIDGANGGDTIDARFMRQDTFTFEPSHTLFLLTNYLPAAEATSPAFWRRVIALPFGSGFVLASSTAKRRRVSGERSSWAAEARKYAWSSAAC